MSLNFNSFSSLLFLLRLRFGTRSEERLERSLLEDPKAGVSAMASSFSFSLDFRRMLSGDLLLSWRGSTGRRLLMRSVSRELRPFRTLRSSRSDLLSILRRRLGARTSWWSSDERERLEFRLLLFRSEVNRSSETINVMQFLARVKGTPFSYTKNVIFSKCFG